MFNNIKSFIRFLVLSFFISFAAADIVIAVPEYTMIDPGANFMSDIQIQQKQKVRKDTTKTKSDKERQQLQKGEEGEGDDRIIVIGDKKVEIRGNISFTEIQRLTGVPADFLIKKLKLPANVSKTRNLGNIRRQYKFEMQDVRNYIREYLKDKK